MAHDDASIPVKNQINQNNPLIKAARLYIPMYIQDDAQQHGLLRFQQKNVKSPYHK